MNNLVEYEWKAEHTDPDGDIQHVDHCGKLTQYFIEQEAEEGTEVIFCLVRNEYDKDDLGNLLDRLHWYPGEGLNHDDEFTPPKKYIAEAKAFGLL